MSYRRAYALDQLVRQVDELAPNRSRRSDGWIGDAAHASRSSDHNPWVKDARGVGVVRAQDLTHDPAGGLDCHQLADQLADQLGQHPALGSGAYLIWNRRIVSTDRRGEGWRTYTGSNPHTAHLHISVGLIGYDAREPWQLTTEEDLNMSPKQLETIVRSVVRDELRRGGWLEAQLNRSQTNGHPAYKGVTVRDLLKRLGRKSGAVKRR